MDDLISTVFGVQPPETTDGLESLSPEARAALQAESREQELHMRLDIAEHLMVKSGPLMPGQGTHGPQPSLTPLNEESPDKTSERAELDVEDAKAEVNLEKSFVENPEQDGGAQSMLSTTEDRTRQDSHHVEAHLQSSGILEHDFKLEDDGNQLQVITESCTVTLPTDQIDREHGGASVNMVVEDAQLMNGDGCQIENSLQSVEVTMREKQTEDGVEEESDASSSSEGDEIEEINRDQNSVVDEAELAKMPPGFVSAMLLDGSLSAEGLASKGFLLTDDSEDESDSHDEEEDEDEDEEDDDDGSDDESEELEDASSDSEKEKDTESKQKGKTAQKVVEEMNDAEESRPPRTKHELDILPPVPKVTAVLQPHHRTVSVGRITSILGLTVIVAASDGNHRVLDENSTLWLTESRTALGIVDEVFGPVKNPLYVVRFNNAEEIPADAKTGADVSYVSEFSEFVLKENPKLYKRAVDASGLDDEELPSDEDLEFSDDEKEAAARLKEKTKRANAARESRSGKGGGVAEGQHLKGQRTDNSRGYGPGSWRAGDMQANAQDSAADFRGRGDLDASGPSVKPKNARNRNQRKKNSAQNASHQRPPAGESGAGASSEFTNSVQHRDGPYFAKQASNQMPSAIPTQHTHDVQISGPFNGGAIPTYLQTQGVSGQHLSNGFPHYGYGNIPGYDAQHGMPGLGIIYAAPQGPQFGLNPGVLGTASGHPNPFFSIQGQGQGQLIYRPGYPPSALEPQMNHGVSGSHMMGNGQFRGLPPRNVLHEAPPMYGGRVVVPDYRGQSVLQGRQGQGPGPFPGRANFGGGGRGFGPGFQQRNER